jgi:hypothetical protein
MRIELEETGGYSAARHVAELTGAKVRVFLSEIAEGVSNYRSMHSLTQQVEHQYHGRFLIELLQNAHDAFTEDASEASRNRVEVVFDPLDSEHGSLLVANDGDPFSPSNFERLSQLGQSDKDPQKSIGNKGIGFRSVLEISAAPEIYSKGAPQCSSFNGYCFAFRPDVVTSLIEPITRLSADEGLPIWSITGEPIVDNWSDEMLGKFRRRVCLEQTSGVVVWRNALSLSLPAASSARRDPERTCQGIRVPRVLNGRALASQVCRPSHLRP